MDDQYTCSECGKPAVVDHKNPPIRPCGCSNGAVVASMKSTLQGQKVNHSFIFVEKANLFYEFSRAGEYFKLPSAVSLSWHFIFIAMELRLKAFFLENGVKIEEMEKRENKDKYGHNVAKMFNNCVQKNYIAKNNTIYKLLLKNNEAYKSNSRNYRYYLGIQDIFTHSKESADDLKKLQEFYQKHFLC